MARRHTIEIDEDDYQRLRHHYGRSWAHNARRILTRALDSFDHEAAIKRTQVPTPVQSALPPLSGGPAMHGRYGWYVHVQKIGDPTVFSCAVYAPANNRSSAAQRASEILSPHEWEIHAYSPQYTHRGNDIEASKRSEGIA
jgi:hypothetical protein